MGYFGALTPSTLAKHTIMMMELKRPSASTLADKSPVIGFIFTTMVAEWLRETTWTARNTVSGANGMDPDP